MRESFGGLDTHKGVFVPVRSGTDALVNRATYFFFVLAADFVLLHFGWSKAAFSVSVLPPFECGWT